MRYFFECTQTSTARENTGIQRVVRNILRTLNSADLAAAPQQGPAEFHRIVFGEDVFLPAAVEISYPTAFQASEPAAPSVHSKLKTLLGKAAGMFRASLVTMIPGRRFYDFVYAPRSRWGLTKLLLSPMGRISRAQKKVHQPHGNGLRFRQGDVLVLLDPSFHLDFWPAIRKAKGEGAKIVVVVYDLIPERYPRFCQPAMVAAFRFWLRNVITHADGVATISRSVATDVEHMLKQAHGAVDSSLRIKSFRLGSELDGVAAAGDRNIPALRALLDSAVPAYAYVSTIEPRKNHAYALSAFELLWQQGVQANFILIGKIGWKSDAFMRRLVSHPEYGKRLFLFQGVGDQDLLHLYQHAQGLIFTSLAEGFGLPVVEALTQGLPAFVSDIPVFREIDVDGIRYVDLNAPASLASALQQHVAAGARRLATPAKWISWEESSTELLDAINDTVMTSHSRAHHPVPVPPAW